MNNYKFSLKRYHRSIEKLTCPSCGHKHRFSPYIDNATGKIIDPECGRCDRINHCGYHLTPREFFRQHPEMLDTKGKNVEYVRRETPEPRLYLPSNVINLYSTPHSQSRLGHWLEKVAPSAELLTKATEDYRLTATTTQGTIFWYIDEKGRFCQGKIMWYREDGHRNGIVSTVSSDMAKKGKFPENAHMQRCLFGAHLIGKYPEKVVAIVEGEKTAVVMSMLKPNFVWLATGGCENLNKDVTLPLVGRKVVIIPDSGCLQKWKKKMSATKGINYSFNEELEAYPPNTDILDVMIPE